MELAVFVLPIVLHLPVVDLLENYLPNASLYAREGYDCGGVVCGHNIDAWLSPSATGTAPEGLSSTGDWALNALWTYTGLPAISLPSGKGDGNLPYGLQITGRLGKDEELLRFAKCIEIVLNS